MLTKKQVDAYRRDGYVKVERLFKPKEVEQLRTDMDRIIQEWGEVSIGWHGPWRDRYLPENERQNTKAVFLHNPHFYSAAWGQAIFHTRMIRCVQQLIGPVVQWHHTVLHAKPPELGTPFPMHQDHPFYPHDGPDFVDCLLHLDETPLESGALRVVPGTHRHGPLQHITGKETAPHLPPDLYHPDRTESVPIPAEAGDVIFFSYYTIHWSDVNRTGHWRRSVRFGYHTPQNRPTGKDPKDPNHNIVAAGFYDKQLFAAPAGA
ncbi:MAG: phytanoyl-CoA dioxygenase family protein [Planctomycetes bacterium]|nr:phytanoyl-CoA dioxygenase family protein [Planctomycetota bacterium]